mgnify:CR=1 FL=1
MDAPLVNAIETGKNIKRLREEKGITVKELQKVSDLIPHRQFIAGREEKPFLVWIIC